MDDMNSKLGEDPRLIETDRLLREIGFLTKALVEVEDFLALERDAHKTTMNKLSHLQNYEQRYLNVINSTSWKITSPLRSVKLYIGR